MAVPAPGRDWTEALQGIAGDLAAAGRRVNPLGLELIGRTLLGEQDLAHAAADLGVTVQAAYKRRSRTEEAIAAFYRITERRPASGRTTVSRGATADAA